MNHQLLPDTRVSISYKLNNSCFGRPFLPDKHVIIIIVFVVTSRSGGVLEVILWPLRLGRGKGQRGPVLTPWTWMKNQVWNILHIYPGSVPWHLVFFGGVSRRPNGTDCVICDVGCRNKAELNRCSQNQPQTGSFFMYRRWPCWFLEGFILSPERRRAIWCLVFRFYFSLSSKLFGRELLSCFHSASNFLLLFCSYSFSLGCDEEERSRCSWWYRFLLFPDPLRLRAFF